MLGSTTAIPSATLEDTIITFNPAAQLLLKLTATNFDSWRSQLETLLMDLDLISYIDGTGVAPAKTVTAYDKIGPNPAYHHWYRQDKSILHTLHCSISESLYSYVFVAATSREAWLILEKLYVGRSQSRIINLKGKLARTVKGNHDILTDVNDLKLIGTELALVDEPVSDLDLVVHCLQGLGPEYNNFSATVRARGGTITIEELLDSLIEFEGDFKEQARLSTIPTAFVTHGHSPRRSSGAGARGHFSGGPHLHFSGGPHSTRIQGAHNSRPQLGFSPESMGRNAPLLPGPTSPSEPTRPRRQLVIC
ncbi:unnamed protein product [Linum trigynum]|uniref:Retrotransposon Copia-like N-terminal domain-containing protein n=1 Tax=Linum trigynum TaxID=586398 RepID=A0AAV2FP18_9ROSI